MGGKPLVESAVLLQQFLGLGKGSVPRNPPGRGGSSKIGDNPIQYPYSVSVSLTQAGGSLMKDSTVAPFAVLMLLPNSSRTGT